MTRIRGFSAVEVIIVVVVVALIGTLGYVAWNNFSGSSTEETAEVSTQTPTSDQQEVTPIESKEDLDKALDTIDSTSVDDSDATAAQKRADL